MRTEIFDFDLPRELIALRPICPRDTARLLVISPEGEISHTTVCNLSQIFTAGDVLVVNDTKVIPARLHGPRRRPGAEGEGPRIEATLHRRIAQNRFRAFAKPARKLAEGDAVRLGQSLEAIVTAHGEGGEVELEFAVSGAALDAAIAREGEMPLPPYIAGKRKPDARDISDYQTMFADKAGSVAAPTAGLHFTPALVAALAAKGVTRETVTLHVGAGTFLPVTAEDTDRHKMHPEFAILTAETASRLNGIRDAGGRIVAAGTTSLRTLESAADDRGRLRAFADDTRLFITPGYRFKAVDILLTNFHLPRSTLFMLTCAFAGTDVMKRAYAEAVARRYRFYSYGDACLLFRPAHEKDIL